MANLGNAWHLPLSAEPRGRGGMRDPVGPIAPGMDVTIFSGNQFRGNGNPGNQLEPGSNLFFRGTGDADWRELPLTDRGLAGNNRYFAATIPATTTQTFAVGGVVEYYLRIAYSDHDTTFVHARGAQSATAADEAVARTEPFGFTLADPATVGRWDPVFRFPNVAIHTNVLPNGRVLMWGRRDASEPDNLDVHTCTPFVWDPADPHRPADSQGAAAVAEAVTVDTDAPVGLDGLPVNLFCSGHAFLPDGRLLVVGGHSPTSTTTRPIRRPTTAAPGPEIWRQTDDKLYWVAGVGTGGTISGVAKYLKEQNPKVQVLGVDTVGSVYKMIPALGAAARRIRSINT